VYFWGLVGGCWGEVVFWSAFVLVLFCCGLAGLVVDCVFCCGVDLSIVSASNRYLDAIRRQIG
jgi:hypothetical protein